MARDAAARAELGRLRRTIARIEERLGEGERLDLGTTAEGADGNSRPERLPLGLGDLDQALGGGLALGTLHEVRAAETRDAATAAGFVFALLAKLAASGEALPLLWVGLAEASREAGSLYAPGLASLGIDPGRLVRVSVKKAPEALWAFEAALACRGLATAICELRGVIPDLTQSRRCALRARENGVTGFFLGLGTPPYPTAAETRFRLSSAPAGTVGGFASGVGRMAWRLSLEKNRGGRIGEFNVEWNAHERHFEERRAGARHSPTAHPEPLAAEALHRPAHPVEWAREGRRRAS